MFLLAFCFIYERDGDNEVLSEATTQEVAVVETVGIDDPPGGIVTTMLDETLGGLDRLDSLLHARALASWATSCERAVMLHVNVEFNILDDWGQR